MAVTRLTNHHEGAGQPSDNVDRFAPEGYSIGIGVTRFKLFRPPWDSWATMFYNHVSLDVCWSGNRMLYPVSDHDLVLLHDAVQAARSAGWIVDIPDVHPHGTLYPVPPGYPTGSSPTQCPGILAVNRWPSIVSMCRVNSPPPIPPAPPPKVPPMPITFVNDPLCIPGKGTWGATSDFGVRTLDAANGGKFYGSMAGNPAVQGRTCAAIIKTGTTYPNANPPLKAYPPNCCPYELIAAESGERYLPKVP